MNQWMSELVNSVVSISKWPSGSWVSHVGLTDSGWKAFCWTAQGTKHNIVGLTMESELLGSFISFLGFCFLNSEVAK